MNGTSVGARTLLGLFAALVAVYHLNPTPLFGNDTRPARFVAVSLVKRGDVDLDEFRPALWPGGPRPPYYLLQGPSGELVSRFGFGAPAAAAPVFAVALALADGKLDDVAAARVGKLAAAITVAGAAVLLALCATRLGASRRVAMGIALLYGLGTCAFSVASQALWQHGPAELFLALGLYLLVRGTPRSIAWAGAALAATVTCRPPDVVFAIAALAWVARQRRDALVGFLLGAAPLALAQLVYNAHYLGAPWRFGQAMSAGMEAGLPASGLWGHSMLAGVAGLLASPSRGLLVYSPFFLLLCYRPLGSWRETSSLLRHFLLGALALLLVMSSWYSWYGGRSWGYRMLVDATPILCLALAPALKGLAQRRVLAAAFAVSVAVSVAIHAVGAFCYDAYAWDAAPSIDRHRERLWSIRDGQLAYWFTHLSPR